MTRSPGKLIPDDFRATPSLDAVPAIAVVNELDERNLDAIGVLVTSDGDLPGGIGLDRAELDASLYDVLMGDRPIGDALRRAVQFPHLDVLGATPDLAGAEVELVDRSARAHAMRDALAAALAPGSAVLAQPAAQRDV